MYFICDFQRKKRKKGYLSGLSSASLQTNFLFHNLLAKIGKNCMILFAIFQRKKKKVIYLA
jgi:hypothetical protein